MKKQGCEIEAIGINYTIHVPKPHAPFQLFGKQDKNKKTQDQEHGVKGDEDDDVLQESSLGSSGDRFVLKGVSCRAKPFEILAIVGPSGAGKSSLLEVLAGKIVPQNGANIFVNKKPLDRAHFRKVSGYVTQKDTLFPLLTVEETLMFTAKLRLRLPDSELSKKVKSLIQELGLSHVANARVGDERVRGISGGERRRVSIGVEVIHDPGVLILDEPTSGLDSTSALQIVDMLKCSMAETRGRTIILSIHQPCFRIVKLFNSILLMANGSVLHHGTIDQLSLKLSLMGLQLPSQVNFLEFAIDSIEEIIQHQQQNKAQSQSEYCFQKEEHQLLLQGGDIEGGGGNSRITMTGKCTLQQLFQQSKVIDEDIAVVVNDDGNYKVCDFANSRLKETIILTHRFWKNVYRTKELFLCRTLQMMVSGIVLGSIFYNLKHEENLLIGAQEKVGLFAFILTFLLSSTTEALPIFLQEKEILMKETFSGSYRVSSYSIANGLVYLPFLLILAVLFSVPLYWLVGLNPSFTAFMHFLLLIWLILYTANSVVVCFSALVPNFIVGNSVVSAVMGSFFLFSGYFVPKQGMPNYWIFMHYISLFKYPFEGFLINEFSGSSKCIDFMFGKCIVTGEDMLREEGYGDGSTRWKNLVFMLCFIFVYRFISYVILRCKCSQRGLKRVL